MGDRNNQALTPSAGRDGEPRGFDWPGFFRNPRVMVQIVLYVLLLYTIGPSPFAMGLFLVWLLLVLPLFVLNLMITHLLSERARKREQQADIRVGRDGYLQ